MTNRASLTVELPQVRGKNEVKPMVRAKPRVQRRPATGKAPGPVELGRRRLPVTRPCILTWA